MDIGSDHQHVFAIFHMMPSISFRCLCPGSSNSLIRCLEIRIIISGHLFSSINQQHNCSTERYNTIHTAVYIECFSNVLSVMVEKCVYIPCEDKSNQLIHAGLLLVRKNSSAACSACSKEITKSLLTSISSSGVLV